MRDALVIGAGPAGSATALALARAGRDVLLLEAERYPVHKLCGEFLSPETQDLFRALGVLDALRARGAVPIRRVRVVAEDGAAFREALPGEAIGLSRHALDPLLFEAALKAGAEGELGARVESVEGDLGRGFVVRYRRGETPCEVRCRSVIGAYGKRARLDRGRAFMERRSDFVAFKRHYEGGDLGGAIELFGFRGGYCGLSAIEGGRINACLIARTTVFREAGSYAAFERSVLRRNGALGARLDGLRPLEERVLSISQISFAEKELVSGGVLMVGDTAAMIAPLCGDGMAMALRGAAIAAPLVLRFLEGGLDARGLERAYSEAWRAEFRARLLIGRALQAGFFRAGLLSGLIGVVNRAPALGALLIRATRGPAQVRWIET